MAAIYLIRHGQASFGTSNYDQLSPRGQQQATALGNSLRERGIQFDAVFAGSMQRHAQTAQNCLNAMDCTLQPEIVPGFNEYDHEEVFARHVPELQSKAELNQYLARFPNPHKTFQIEFEKAVRRWRSGEFDSDYSETWHHFRQRCLDALAVVRNCRAKSIAVFSSGGPIGTITGHVLGVQDDHSVELTWAIMNCSITSLLFNQEKISLRYFNDFAHFDNGEKALLTHR
jgi:broad specificity phosphatase PhoE